MFLSDKIAAMTPKSTCRTPRLWTRVSCGAHYILSILADRKGVIGGLKAPGDLAGK